MTASTDGEEKGNQRTEKMKTLLLEKREIKFRFFLHGVFWQERYPLVEW